MVFRHWHQRGDRQIPRHAAKCGARTWRHTLARALIARIHQNNAALAHEIIQRRHRRCAGRGCIGQDRPIDQGVEGKIILPRPHAMRFRQRCRRAPIDEIRKPRKAAA